MEYAPDDHADFVRTTRHSLVIPVVLILMISVVLIGGLVVLAARSQDRLAAESSTHLTRSVLNDIEERLAHQLLDYSYWDEAVDNLVVTFDVEWADKNVGIYLHDNFNITSSYVLDAGNRPVYGMSGGRRSAADPLALFTGGLPALIERARSGPRTKPPVPAAGLLRDGRVVHIAAASVLTAFQKNTGAPAEIATGWVLIFTKALDPGALAMIAEKYLLDGLRLVGNGAGPETTILPLIGADGSRLGSLDWRLDMPGTRMLQWVLPVVAFLFAILIGLALAFLRRTNTVTQAFYREIADRKDAERELEQTEIMAHARKMEALGSMVGGITHNFNNLLTPILAWTWETKERLPAGSTERQTLEKVVEASGDARDMVARIMAFARKDPPEKKIMDINGAVESSLMLAHSTMPPHIELEENLDPDVGDILADETQIQSILLNLISNAVDALEGRNGRISVSLSRLDVAAGSKESAVTRKTGAYAKLSVADDGKGMDETTVTRIFDPFFTTKEHGTGTGLGLSSAYGIVIEHGGRIHVTSAPGAGAVFDVYLPLAAPDSVRPTPPADRDRPVESGNR